MTNGDTSYRKSISLSPDPSIRSNSIPMSLGNVFHLVGCAISREQADISLKYLDWKKDYDVISYIFFPGKHSRFHPDL